MGEVLDDTIAAVEELLSLCDEEELGFPKLTVDGVEKDAVVTNLEADQIIAAGGTGEGGGFSAVVRASDFPTNPEGKPASARGINVHVLRRELNTYYHVLICGDPIQE